MDYKKDYTEKDIKLYLKKLKKNELGYFDIPSEIRLNPAIVKVERDLGIRKASRRGYDIITKFFYVEEIILIKPYDEIREKKIENSFESFGIYHDFLEGDIYDNACYYGYYFSQEEIERHQIDISKVKFAPFAESNIEDFTLELSVKEAKKYKTIENEKKYRKKWIEKFNSCNTYSDLLEVIQKCKKSKFANDILFFLYNYIYADIEGNFNNIMKYVSEGHFPAFNAAESLCLVYDPDKVISAYDYKIGAKSTILKHKRFLKEHVNDLKNGNLKIHSSSYFDENTHFFCIEVSGSRKDDIINWGPYFTTYRYFESFNEFVKYLGGDLSFCDISKANIPNVNFEQYKINEYTKLPWNAQDLKYRVIKEYDRKKECFVVKQIWTDKNDNIIKDHVHIFDHFSQFLAFLKGDLTNANLLYCDGLSNLPSTEGIILDGAILTSGTMDKLGIPYSGYPFELMNIEPDKSILENEKKTVNVLQEYRDNNDWDWKKQTIYYISDLHLVHKIQNAGCKSLNDIIYTVQKIIDDLLDTAGRNLLIGGDVSSEYVIYELFVRLLKKSLDERNLKKNIIFVLGNHELWGFKGETLDNIYRKYERLLEENEMILLQNNLIYYDDNGMHKILEHQLEDMTKEEIKGLLRTARYIVIGGLAFSGYNYEFNANNGIYRQTVDRQTEIAESKRFEILYNRLIPVLQDKDTIIFTHTPKKDWSRSEDCQKNFIYVSGHTHRNFFYDDGVYRIYSDNQIGYKNKKTVSKWFSIDGEYDWYSDYEDGIYKITGDDYVSFYRGKNIRMDFGRQINILYMLKKSGYYCFIHQAKDKKLCILNGGALKQLDRRDVRYYYDHMEEQIALIEKPYKNYTAFQKLIANEIKKLGGKGSIHGAIVDIDVCNHIYVNPIDLKLTGYWAANIIDKVVYPSIPDLLKAQCPILYDNYKKLVEGRSTCEFAIIENKDKRPTASPQIYLETDIYKASREIKKMQKIEKHILTTWYRLKDEMLAIDLKKKYNISDDYL